MYTTVKGYCMAQVVVAGEIHAVTHELTRLGSSNLGRDRKKGRNISEASPTYHVAFLPCNQTAADNLEAQIARDATVRWSSAADLCMLCSSVEVSVSSRSAPSVPAV